MKRVTKLGRLPLLRAPITHGFAEGIPFFDQQWSSMVCWIEKLIQKTVRAGPRDGLKMLMLAGSTLDDAKVERA